LDSIRSAAEAGVLAKSGAVAEVLFAKRVEALFATKEDLPEEVLRRALVYPPAEAVEVPIRT
jgi:hypothetical protein